MQIDPKKTNIMYQRPHQNSRESVYQLKMKNVIAVHFAVSIETNVPRGRRRKNYI